MNWLPVFAVIFTITVSASKCSDKKEKTTRYKGKLEIKALCMNYTIRLMEGDLDTSMINSTWTDESTGKIYQNVFGLGSPCIFPGNIKEGDEFYFVIDTATLQQCAVCMAYYPTPSKKLPIKVLEK